jgi:hypothetical protein
MFLERDEFRLGRLRPPQCRPETPSSPAKEQNPDDLKFCSHERWVSRLLPMLRDTRAARSSA